jgi:hypothetical protein
MTKKTTSLEKKPHEYGSPFTAIEELDRACTSMERIMGAKIGAISDLLAENIKRLDLLEKQLDSKSVAKRKKIQASGRDKQTE